MSGLRSAALPEIVQCLQDDNKWQQYFDNPQDYFDNRMSKTKQSQPDFKSKSNGEALWLNSAPDWAKQQLEG